MSLAPKFFVYTGTKAALHAFVEGLRADLLGANVDLTAIEIVPTKQVFGGSTIAKRPTPGAT